MTETSLDRVGATIGLPRARGENEVDYRIRLNCALAISLKLGTVSDICSVLLAAVPHTWEVTVTTERPGHATIRMCLPWWRRLLVFPARGDRRRAAAAIEERVAAGVTWELITRRSK